MSTLSKALVAVFAIGAAAAIVAWLLPSRLERAVHDAVVSYVADTAGTPADLDATSIDLGSSRATLSRLTVGNPEGYASQYAMRVGEIDVDLAARSLIGDVLHIEQIAVHDVEVQADHRGSTSNITEILDNMADESEPAEPSAEAQRVRIDRFVLTTARITVDSDALSEPQEIELPRVELAGIGGASGTTYAEAVEAVLRGILGAARTAALERVRGAAGEAVRESATEAVEERLRDLVEE